MTLAELLHALADRKASIKRCVLDGEFWRMTFASELAPEDYNVCAEDPIATVRMGLRILDVAIGGASVEVG